MAATKRYPKALHFRLSDEEYARLEKLKARFPVPTAVVARRAMNIGLGILEADTGAFAHAAPPAPPEAIVEPAAPAAPAAGEPSTP